MLNKVKIKTTVTLLTALLLLSLVATLMTPSEANANEAPATINIEPDTLNLASNGQWITAYISLDGNSVEDIEITTVTLSVASIPETEHLEIVTGYMESDTTAKIVVMNAGSVDATITNVTVNGQSPIVAFTEISLTPGNSTTITVLSADYLIGTFESGTVYEFIIHTAAGGSYPKLLEAP